MNFLHTYKDPETFKPVMEFKLIAWNYMRNGWFVVDFVSVFPFRVIFQDGKGSITKLFRLLRLPRLLKLMDTQRFKKIIESMMTGGDTAEENITL